MSGSRRGLYNYSKSDYLCRYGNRLRHEAIRSDDTPNLDLSKGKLYLSKNLVFHNGQLVIKKGTDLTALFKVPEEPVIKHYGRSKRDGAPGPGTGNYLRNSSRTHKNDLIYKKDFENLTRFVSDIQAEEAGVLKTAYYASNWDDVVEYDQEFTEGMFGNSRDHRYRINITTKHDVRVRNGRDVIKDVISKIDTATVLDWNKKTINEDGKEWISVDPQKKKVTKKQIQSWFDALDKLDYFNPNNTMNDKHNISASDDKLFEQRSYLAQVIHEYVYANRNAFADYYAKAGYSAIIDPEDFANGYVSPIIITNPDDFKITKIYKEW